MILYEKTKQEFGYDWDSASQYKNFYCVCDYCGKEFLRCKKTIKQCNQTVSKDSCGIGICKKNKSEEVQLIKFGVKNVGGSAESMAKKKQTCQELYGSEYYQTSDTYIKDNQEKYGVAYHTQTQEWKDKIKDVHIENRGVDHHTKDPAYQEQLKEKCQEKYGVDHFMQTKEFQDKVKDTMLEKYGEYYIATDECKERVKNTNLERYGFQYPMQSEEIKQKVHNYFLEEYEMHYSQTEEFKQKLTEAYRTHYGVDHYSQTQEFKDVLNEIFLAKYGMHLFKTEEFLNKRKETCILKYGVDHYAKTKECREKTIQTCIERYGTAHPNLMCGKTQKEICNWLNSFGFNFVENDYKILQGKEIDLYDKNLNLAVEYCGLYWHSEESPQPRGKDYHYLKYKNCADQNIRLITIFEDEWIFRNAQCKNFLKSVLGKFDSKVFARKCEVKQVEKEIANDFYDKNHILGSYNLLVVSFGLYFNNELIGLISLGRHHRQKDGIILSRLCFKDGVQVVGGASKLFKQCIEWAKNDYKDIISWSDNRWSNGDIYKVLNFSLDEELLPDYSYVDLNTHFKRVSKQSQMKSNVECPADKTEKEWCLERGLVRIWDCGKKRWIYRIN